MLRQYNPYRLLIHYPLIPLGSPHRYRYRSSLFLSPSLSKITIDCLSLPLPVSVPAPISVGFPLWSSNKGMVRIWVRNLWVERPGETCDTSARGRPP